LNGNRNFSKLTRFVARYEKYVKAFMQYYDFRQTNFSESRLELNCLARARNPDSTSRF
jgi:hypothetical protein